MKIVVGCDVRSVRLRGKPQMSRMDDVKKDLDERGVFVEQGSMFVCDRSEWRAVLNA